MSLLPLLDGALLARRDTIALEFLPEGAPPLTLTFGDVDRRSNRMAHALAARGLTAGDRLAVFLTNCVEFLDLYLACIKLGVIFVPVNVLYREREIRHILGDADPKAVVTNTALAEHLRDAGTVWLLDELNADAAGRSAERPAHRANGDDAAALVYTSGTTGASKGAILTHHNFSANAANLVALWQFTAADRLLCTLPLFHVHGLGNAVHCWLASGCHMRLLERFEHEIAVHLPSPGAPGADAPGTYARAYVAASLAPSAPGEERLGTALLAAAAGDPSLLAPIQAAAEGWQDRLVADGLDPAQATALRMACDGLWLCDLFGLAPPAGDLRAAVGAFLADLAEDPS